MRNSSALLSSGKKREKKKKNPLLPPFSPHFVWRGFVLGVLLGIPNEPGRDGDGDGAACGCCRGPGHSSRCGRRCPRRRRRKDKAHLGHAHLPDLLPPRRKSCPVLPPMPQRSLSVHPSSQPTPAAPRGKIKAIPAPGSFAAREGLGSAGEEHGDGDGKGQQGLAGMDVPRCSGGIKAELLRRQLPSNNARDRERHPSRFF